MIDRIHGKLVSKLPTYVTVDVNGTGYGLHVPLSTYTRLQDIGNEQELHTYLHVRDDAIQLFGFVTEEEKTIFKLLLSVTGIGPRMALGILSTLSVNELRQAVNSENVSLLITVPGIGKKTGQRLLLELRDKIGPPAEKICLESSEETGIEGQTKDAASALVSLGCKPQEALKAIREARKVVPEGCNLEELIKEALKHL